MIVPPRPEMGIFQALSVGHTGVRYLPRIRPSRRVGGRGLRQEGREIEHRGSKLRPGGAERGDCGGDSGNEGMRAALLIRVYLPLHSCLYRETSALRSRALVFIRRPIKFPALFFA